SRRATSTKFAWCRKFRCCRPCCLKASSSNSCDCDIFRNDKPMQCADVLPQQTCHTAENPISSVVNLGCPDFRPAIVWFCTGAVCTSLASQREAIFVACEDTTKEAP